MAQAESLETCTVLKILFSGFPKHSCKSRNCIRFTFCLYYAYKSVSFVLSLVIHFLSIIFFDFTDASLEAGMRSCAVGSVRFEKNLSHMPYWNQMARIWIYQSLKSQGDNGITMTNLSKNCKPPYFKLSLYQIQVSLPALYLSIESTYWWLMG